MTRLRDLIERLLGSNRGRQIMAGAAAVAGVTLFFSSVALAEGGAHAAPHINWFAVHEPGQPPPLGWMIVDFIIFIGIVVFAAKKPFVTLLQKRHDDVKAAIAEAHAAQVKAAAFEKEYADKLGRVDTEVSALLEGAKKDGERERDRIIAAANAYAGRLRSDNANAVERELHAAQGRLLGETATAVLDQATQILNQKLDDKAQASLIEQGIADLEAGKFSLESGAGA